MWLARSKNQKNFATLSSVIFSTLSAFNRKPWNFGLDEEISSQISLGVNVGANKTVREDLSHLERDIRRSLVA